MALAVFGHSKSRFSVVYPLTKVCPMLRPLKIMLLSDGIPGHFQQSRGLVSWIQRRRDVEVLEVECKIKRRNLTQLLSPWIMKLGPSGASWVIGQYTGSPAAVDADLIISAGGRTSFLNAALAIQHRKPNIFIGSLRRLDPGYFMARLALEQSAATNDAIVAELAPTTTNAWTLSENRGHLRAKFGLSDRETAIAVLIGGDGAGFRYTEKDWQLLATLVERAAALDSARLLITTSRRTGDLGEALVQQYLPPRLLAHSVWWKTKPEPITSAYLAACDKVVVTADSMTMITEALSSGKPVTAFGPSESKMDDRYAKALARLTEKRILTLSTAEDAQIDWPSVVLDTDRIIEDVLDRLNEATGLFPATQAKAD
jgi:mitochondrial fission protein ELM1